MTLQLPTPSPAVPPRPALGILTPAGRAALLDMTWAAWCSTLPDDAVASLAGVGAGRTDEAAGAAQLASEVTLKLLRLRRIAVGDAMVTELVEGLREGRTILNIPHRLYTVLAASEEQRITLLTRVQAEVELLPVDAADTVAAVLAYLVATRVDLEAGGLVEAPEARGQTRALLQALGLPFASYMPRLRAWL